MEKKLQITKLENENFITNFEESINTSEELVWFENLNSLYTSETYKNSLASFCKLFEIQNLDQLKQVETIHIVRYRNFLKTSGSSKATINTRLSSLSSLFKHLIEKQIIKINPVDGVKRAKRDYIKVKSRALDDFEVKKILSEPDTSTIIGLRDKAILSIMFNVGTRVGTIAKLTGKDIYLENGYLIIDMHLKGDKRNKVAVNSNIYQNLKNYFDAIGYSSKNDLGFEIADNLPIFPQMSLNPNRGKITKGISPNNLYRMWQKYANRAGLERTNPHCARTTFITNALDKGCDLQHVQTTAGHSDPRTTMSYNHSRSDYKNSASLAVSYD